MCCDVVYVSHRVIEMCRQYAPHIPERCLLQYVSVARVSMSSMCNTKLIPALVFTETISKGTLEEVLQKAKHSPGRLQAFIKYEP